MIVMNKKQTDEISRELCKLDYAAIHKRLAELSPDDAMLIAFINVKSRKVADTACEILSSRDSGPTSVVDAVKAGTFTHRDAKVRATNLLSCYGRKVAGGLEACISLLKDRSDDVVGNALFNIAFWQEDTVIPLLSEISEALPTGSERRAYFEKCIESIETRDPKIYSTYFHDEENVWGLR